MSSQETRNFKRIKFNLKFGDITVRNIEQLRNEFYIQDLLAYYQNGLLQRWLEIQNYKEELEAVKEITSTDDIQIIHQLIKIFELPCTQEEAEEGVLILRYFREKASLQQNYEKNKEEREEFIRGHIQEYNKLVGEIRGDKRNLAKIKANVKAIVDDFQGVLDLHQRMLFWSLLEKQAYTAIMCLLMHEKIRKFWLPIKIKDKDGNVINDIGDQSKKHLLFYQDKAQIHRELCNLITQNDFKDILGNNLRT